MVTKRRVVLDPDVLKPLSAWVHGTNFYFKSNYATEVIVPKICFVAITQPSTYSKHQISLSRLSTRAGQILNCMSMRLVCCCEDRSLVIR